MNVNPAEFVCRGGTRTPAFRKKNICIDLIKLRILFSRLNYFLIYNYGT